MRLLIPSLCLAFAVIAGPVNANTILLDLSPNARPNATLQSNDYGWAANEREGQHYAESFSFSSAATIDGMGIYSGYFYGYVGDTVTIDLWQDNSGVPGALLHEFQERISAVNTDGASRAQYITQKYASFSTPISVVPNTVYWIGMSGGTASSYGELGQLTLDPAVYHSAVFPGDTFVEIFPYGDTSMRLYGTIPDGGLTIAMLGMGVTGLAFIRRKL